MEKNERKINNYIFELNSNANEIEELDKILNNLAKFGEKSILEKFGLNNRVHVRPYKHNISIHNDGKVSIDIFETKDLQRLKEPLKYEIGFIKDFKK